MTETGAVATIATTTIGSIELNGHSSCEACHLAKTRKNVVPGYGDVRAPLVFVGEAPGQKEDEAADGVPKPFIGPAGQLLRRVVDGLGFDPEKLFYTNVYHCRPPGNDIALAKGSPCPSIWLTAELRRLDARVVVALGATAAGALRPWAAAMPMSWHIGQVTPLTPYMARGRDVSVVAAYHPSYVLKKGGDGKEDNVALVKFVRSLVGAFALLKAVDDV